MTRAHPRIVCGVNGSTSSGLALCEALRRAVESDARVTVVTAYDAVGYSWGALAALPGSGWLPVFGRGRIQAAEDATLQTFVDEVLADPPRALPRDLPPIQLRAVPGDPVDVLVRASVDATALVVGHGEEAGPLRSVAAGCTRHARCPVIVVPAGRTTTPRSAGP
ncbi:universal stress protein [Actinomycetospora cinnamomea]|uniref:Nucleotide-binding universal stress UspA family protein n=1 Tax=Actinomycetospora cinnamomea TaxID=663609 RepID=A0A2U1F2F9_9PSEU|nr:universal stress protein [Actinomycetospora cinnamomea]PVZ06352.1 nucleotide-binding universal stress UspA family protein [Actinomycetospora cinnamomea]